MLSKINGCNMSFSRPVGGTPTGFGAVINRYPETHDQRYFDTTFKDFHGELKKETANTTIEQIQSEYSK